MRLRFIWIGVLGWAVTGLHAEGASGSKPVTSAIHADRRTGKLRRFVDRAAGQPAPSYDRTVERIAAEESVAPELLRSVIKVESDYDPYAVSPKGALGLMQLIPTTARRFGVKDAFDPAENIRAGAKYLRYLLDLYSGDSKLALAAYNAGEGAVARYGDVPPFPETRRYVDLIGKRLPRPAEPVAENGARAGGAADAGVGHIEEVVQPDGTVRYVAR